MTFFPILVVINSNCKYFREIYNLVFVILPGSFYLIRSPAEIEVTNALPHHEAMLGKKTPDGSLVLDYSKCNVGGCKWCIMTAI